MCVLFWNTRRAVYLTYVIGMSNNEQLCTIITRILVQLQFLSYECFKVTTFKMHYMSSLISSTYFVLRKVHRLYSSIKHF